MQSNQSSVGGKKQTVAEAVATGAMLQADSINGATSAEKWYLRIDEQEYGPMTRAQMEYFLRPPRLCSHLRIMCSEQMGTWYMIDHSETIEKVLCRFGIQPEFEPTGNRDESRPFTSSWFVWSVDVVRDQFEQAQQLVIKYRRELGLLLGIVLFNVAFFCLSRDAKDRDRQILGQFEQIWGSVQEFDPNDPDSDEWRSFADRTLTELSPLIDELKKTANSKRPVRQSLLVGGKEHLVKVLAGATPEGIDSRDATLFELQLRKARKHLLKD